MSNKTKNTEPATAAVKANKSHKGWRAVKL